MEKKARILIIDDEEDVCMFSKSFLEKTGKFEVFFSMHAGEGLDLARNKKPDLILLDIRMPEMDGGEVARHLYEDESTRAIPVVFLSAVAAPAALLISMLQDLKQTAQNYGYNFIQKPIVPDELINRLESILAQK